MNVTRLEVQNFKRVKAVRVAPDGSLALVGGRNGAGKSSVLDAIQAALGGTRSCPQKPVRDGAERGEVRMDLSNGYRIVRTFSPSGHTELQVFTPAGDVARSPQGLLDGWLGQLAFDPLEFERLKPRQQAEALKDLLGLDTSEIEARRQAAYDERTHVHRRQKEIEARMKDVIGVDDAPDQEVSVAELAAEISAIAEHNARVRAAHAEVETQRNAALSARGMAERAEAEIADLEARLEAAKERLRQANALAKESDQRADQLLGEIEHMRDARPVQERLDHAEAINQKVRLKAKRDEARAEWQQLEARRAALEAEIEACDQERQRLLREAPYPYEGMAYSEDGVLLGGLPFEQASKAERLRASVAVGLAQNPALKVMLVRDGSLLDKASMAELAAIAEARGAQLWVEVVAEPDESGAYPPGLALVVEDGEQVAAAVAK